MGCPTGSGNQDFEASLLGIGPVAQHGFRGAMRRDHVDFRRNAESIERG
jgi:hypothetical protein